MTAGHLFIIDGDITKLACDAWLLPTDHLFRISPAFFHSVGMTSAGQMPGAPDNWPDGGCLLWSPAHDRSPTDLWLGDIGRRGQAIGVNHYAKRARSFIRQASGLVRQRRPDITRAPLVAVNVLGSGRGGKRSERGKLLQALVPALLQSAVDYDCDVVLVAYGPVVCAAAQKVRCDLGATDHRYWATLPKHLSDSADAVATLTRVPTAS